MSWETLLTSCADGVARIVLNRPEVRNAPSRTLIDELATALAAFFEKGAPQWKGR